MDRLWGHVLEPHKRLVLFLSLLFLFVLVLGYSLTLIFVTGDSLNFDLSVSANIQSLQTPLFAYWMETVSFFGNGPFMIVPFILVFTWLWRIGHKQEAFFLPLTFAAPIVSELSKLIVSRPRPVESLVSVSTNFSGYSFPSGHVLYYCLFFGFLAFLALSLPSIKPVIRALIFGVSFLLLSFIGLSRVYLGAHWPTDVIAGYLLGFALLEVLLLIYVREIYLPKVRNKQ